MRRPLILLFSVVALVIACGSGPDVSPTATPPTLLPLPRPLRPSPAPLLPSPVAQTSATHTELRPAQPTPPSSCADGCVVSDPGCRVKGFVQPGTKKKVYVVS